MNYLETRKCVLEAQLFVLESEKQFLATFGGTIETANRHRVLTGVIENVTAEVHRISTAIVREFAEQKIAEYGSKEWFDHIIETNMTQLKGMQCVILTGGISVTCIIQSVSHRVGETYPRMILRAVGERREHPLLNMVRTTRQFKEEFVKWL